MSSFDGLPGHRNLCSGQEAFGTTNPFSRPGQATMLLAAVDNGLTKSEDSDEVRFYRKRKQRCRQLKSPSKQNPRSSTTS